MKIGIYGNDYPSMRMIIKKVNDAEYIECKRRNKKYIFVIKCIGKIIDMFKKSQFYENEILFTLCLKRDKQTDVIHLFNRICHSRVPWVGTFEKTFPEYSCEDGCVSERITKRELEYLNKSDCIAILAMSNWAYHYQIRLLRQMVDDIEYKNITKKMMVLYPPQEALVDQGYIKDKYHHMALKEIKFIYVGAQIKRKGGILVLKVLNELGKKYRFSLVFVGNVKNGYNNYFLSDEEKEVVRTIIQNNPWIEYYESLPNEQVILKMKESHVGLLPTLGDTFGFSVLEMQSCGCPVISTNREALAEINNNHCGWIIDTKAIELEHGDDYGNYSVDEIDLLSAKIEKDLRSILDGIFKDPQVIVDKAVIGLQRIQKYHSPETYENQLKKIYGGVV